MEHAIKNFEIHSRNDNQKNQPRKVVHSHGIPTKIIKDCEDLLATFICNNYNNSLLDGNFPEDFKIVDVMPVNKNKKCTDKNNYRPVSILSNILTIYERSFYNQMHDYFDGIF